MEKYINKINKAIQNKNNEKINKYMNKIIMIGGKIYKGLWKDKIYTAIYDTELNYKNIKGTYFNGTYFNGTWDDINYLNKKEFYGTWTDNNGEYITVLKNIKKKNCKIINIKEI